MKRHKNLIKQIGLSTYALSEAKYKNHFYEDIKHEKIGDSSFLSLSKDKIHGYTEGMLIEIGIFNSYETYTSDKNIIFNGKRLCELVYYTALPNFSYSEILDKVKQIDVIWFKDRFPVKTFDVEISTDFTKAFLRVYQLKNFKTKFYMVAPDDKIGIYEDRKNTPPFNALKEDTNFISFRKVFEEYKNAVIHDKIKSKSLFVS